MRHLHKKVIRVSQIILIALAFFVLNGLLSFILFLFSEVSLAEILEYLEAMSAVEAVGIGAMIIKVMAGKMKFDDLINFLLGLIDGTSDNDKDAKEILRVIERE